jgi:hypothetical protein
LTSGEFAPILSGVRHFLGRGAVAEQLIVKNLPFIKVLPSWAQELSYKYCSKTANLYILSGNIRDFLPHKMKEG